MELSYLRTVPWIVVKFIEFKVCLLGGHPTSSVQHPHSPADFHRMNGSCTVGAWKEMTSFGSRMDAGYWLGRVCIMGIFRGRDVWVKSHRILRICRSHGEVKTICWELYMPGAQSVWLEGAVAKYLRADRDQIMQGPRGSQFRTCGPGEVVKSLQFIKIPAPAVWGMDQKRAETWEQEFDKEIHSGVYVKADKGQNECSGNRRGENG